MKKITLLLLLLAVGAVNAQIVNIPDANFKNYLLSNSQINSNSDSEIQVAEAQAQTQLSIYGSSISPFSSLTGIEAFTNVNHLVISVSTINSLDLSALTQLYFLSCTGSNIQSLNLTGLVNLTDFSFTGNNLINFDISTLTQLEYLNCSGNGIESLNLSGLVNLIHLTFNGNSLNSLDLTSLESLEEIDLNHVILSSLDLGVAPGLTDVTIVNSSLEIVDFTGCINLEQLLLSGNYENINISDCTNLEAMNIQTSESVLNLTMGFHPELNIVGVSGPVQVIDLSGCPNISNLNIYIENLSADSFINLKNGRATYSSGMSTLSFDSALYKCYVCTDLNEQLFVNPINENTYLSTYCTFTPGGTYNTIAGSVTFDADGDGCTTSDTIFPFTAVQINDGITTGKSLNSNGNYNFYTQAGTFTLTPQFENDYFTANPETVTFADNNNTATQNFCVTANGVHSDVEVTLVPILAARPGFDVTYKLIYKNKGNQTLNGAVSLTYDDAVLDYVSASPVENSVATGSLSWNYSSLLPFESREILLTLNVNSPMETPAVNNDDVLPFTVGITPNLGDETPADNTFALNQTVVGSYDPNDITCLEGATVNPDKIGDYLHYNINFENTGTYPASFVVVKDIIDPAKFDVSSLVVLNASHAVETRVTGNKIEFYFGDINLAANGGKGNVTFKIKSLESLAINSSVMQKADIFFDYNWPIVTNEAVTTYAILNNTGFTKDASVKIYPNPAANVISISADSAIQSIQLFDVQGRLLEATSVNDISTTLDIAARAKGIYFIKIATDNGVNFEKLVKE